MNNSIKYNFIIRIFIQIMYDFRTREAFDLLRIENFDLIISEVRVATKVRVVMKTRTVTLIIYPIIIKNVIRNDVSISRRRISSLKVIIFVMSLTSR